MVNRIIRLDSDTLPEGIIKLQARTSQEKQRLKLENLTYLAKASYQCETTMIIACVGRFSKWKDQLRRELTAVPCQKPDIPPNEQFAKLPGEYEAYLREKQKGRFTGLKAQDYLAIRRVVHCSFPSIP